MPVVSDTNLWFWLMNGKLPDTPCATRAASFELIDAFGPPVFVGLIVYAPAPKPVKVYVPGVPVITGPTAGDPTVLATETFLTNLGAGGLLIALPYVIVPEIDPEGVPPGVAVFVAVAVFVDVAVGDGPALQ